MNNDVRYEQLKKYTQIGLDATKAFSLFYKEKLPEGALASIEQIHRLFADIKENIDKL